MSNRPITTDINDLDVPGAIVEVDPAMAEALGAFREDALTAAAALAAVPEGDE